MRFIELPFTAEERDHVTILFGGLTWKHEQLIEGLLAGSGYRCQRLSETDRGALFGDDVAEGQISSPLDISDVWKHSFSCSSNHKIWPLSGRISGNSYAPETWPAFTLKQEPSSLNLESRMGQSICS